MTAPKGAYVAWPIIIFLSPKTTYAEDFIFCTLVGHVKYSLQIDKQSLKWAWTRSRDLFKFCEIIDNVLEMVQDRDIVTIED